MLPLFSLFTGDIDGVNLCSPALYLYVVTRVVSTIPTSPALIRPSLTRVPSYRLAAVFAGVSQGEASLVQARQGGSVELSCNLAPPSKDVTAPRLFPLHVVEWVRLGFNIPILIKFGVYAPRVHPNYKGKTLADVAS